MRRWLRVIVLVVLLGALAGGAAAQTGGGYNLMWHTVDGGGWTFSTGGEYSLGGTAGQADAEAMTGGTYALQGGFWTQPGSLVYVPVARKP